MISINDSRGHERIFQSRERGGGGLGEIGKEEVIYGLFFFFSAGSFLKHGRSTPNDAGVGSEIFKY